MLKGFRSGDADWVVSGMDGTRVGCGVLEFCREAGRMDTSRAGVIVLEAVLAASVVVGLVMSVNPPETPSVAYVICKGLPP